MTEVKLRRRIAGEQKWKAEVARMCNVEQQVNRLARRREFLCADRDLAWFILTQVACETAGRVRLAGEPTLRLCLAFMDEQLDGCVSHKTKRRQIEQRLRALEREYRRAARLLSAPGRDRKGAGQRRRRV